MLRREQASSKLPGTMLALLLAASAVAPARAAGPPADAPRIDFNRQIRPILADNCYECHGPDARVRKAGLRLDVADGATSVLPSGRTAIVPGRRDQGRLLARVSSDDPDVRMPPPQTGRRLSAVQIQLLADWIDQGAEWPPHWAFVTPERPPLPPVERDGWAINGIDHFILARLEAEGLAPSPPADRETIIRRLSLDLTGLPPTIEEIDAFLADEAPDAYEKVVDRLLGSPRYGERMAMEWLDAARYADTHGYHYDNERTMWKWREWVIDAFNRNLPFDQFTVDQLAGDLLPEPTLKQRIATGFNRNHGITWEGGVIPEEYRIEYVVDRVNTTATIWLGLTMGCARCHDHKFDPISQKEFYGFSAFFNSVAEKGADGLQGNAVPFIRTPTTEQAAQLAALQGWITELGARRDAPDPELDAAQRAWADEVGRDLESTWTVLDPFSYHSRDGAVLEMLDDGSILARGPHPDRDVYEIVTFTDASVIRAVRLETLTHESLPHGGPGRARHSNFVLSEFELEIAPLDQPGHAVPVVFDAAQADYSQRNFLITRAIDGNAETGWAVMGGEGENHVALFVPREPFGFPGGTALRFRLRFESSYTMHSIGRIRLGVTADEHYVRAVEPCGLGEWHAVGPFPAETGEEAYTTEFGPERRIGLADTLEDGALPWSVRPELVDGRAHGLSGENSATYLYRSIHAPEERQTTVSLGSDDALKVWLNGELVLESAAPRGVAPDQNVVRLDLRPGENHLLLKVVNYGGEYAFYFDKRDDNSLDPPLPIRAIVSRAPERRSEKQIARLRDHFRIRHSPAQKRLIEELAALQKQEKELVAPIPTTMVMADLPEPRETFVLVRGQYDRPAEPVSPHVPSVLPPLPEGAPVDRLGLARWMVDPSHPLTARVTVNRFWQQFFGTGLVATAEDFGTRGDLPTHPELLDWLAWAFAGHGWDVKAMQKLIVSSAAYRQTSRVTPELLRRDPQNRLLARGPRLRLPAEMIRDQALAVSGLLVEKIGGPSVKPYQPAGLWREVGSDFNAFSANQYEQDQGDALYRRSLYTFWKRTVPPPALLTFDAPTREYCVVRRSRTNTPLQALVLMNDPTYVEAARHLAERVMLEGGADVAKRIEYAFRLATARRPSASEVELVRAVFQEQWDEYRRDPEAASRLLGVGESPTDRRLDQVELAAWTTVASLILNLDETITKG